MVGNNPSSVKGARTILQIVYVQTGLPWLDLNG